MSKKAGNIEKILGETSFYHGSPYRIEKFSLDYCGKGIDQSGSGLYFVSDKTVAMGYCQQNEEKKQLFPDMQENPTLHKVKISAKKPLGADEVKSLTRSQVKRFLMASPTLHDDLTNYGDVDYEGYNKVLESAIDAYSDTGDTPLLKVLHMLGNDFFDGSVREFNAAITKVLGYDCIIDPYDDSIIINVLDENDIEIIQRTQYKHLVCEDSPTP